MFIFIYNLFFPLVFLFFIPGLLIKLIRRSGIKRTFPERFGIFSAEKKKQIQQFNNAIWLHAVSVGETNLALTAIAEWNKSEKGRKFILTTTTTTAQEIAQKKAPENTLVMFSPLDFLPVVKRFYKLLKPAGAVIFETEIWPNMISQAKKNGLNIALVNARMSDHSVKGYRRFRAFFAPTLNKFDAVCVQTETDKERYLSVAPALAEKLSVCGNIKFDQKPPENLRKPDLREIFGYVPELTIIGSSTHKGEEEWIADAFLETLKQHPEAALIIVPRHSERGAAIYELLCKKSLQVLRRSSNERNSSKINCLLADTTGELMGFLSVSDIVIQGKTLNGNNEGQNIIEPAVLAKPVICGMELRNFRQALDILVKANSVIRVENETELAEQMMRLANDRALRSQLGQHAFEAISANTGAMRKNLEVLKKLF